MIGPQQNMLQHYFGATNRALYLQIDSKTEGQSF